MIADDRLHFSYSYCLWTVEKKQSELSNWIVYVLE